MKRSELIKKVGKYFTIAELVCPHVFQRDGENAWRYFSNEYLETLVAIREILNLPMTINNWSKGGKFSQRGLRCNICDLVASKTRGGQLYVSAHMLAQGFDFSTTIPAHNVRDILKKNVDKLPYPIRLEKDVTWVHVDLYQVSDKNKITEFKG